MPSQKDPDLQSDSPNVRRYRPSFWISASVLLHILGLIAVCIHAAIWPYVIGLLLLDHCILTLFGLWPRSSGLGPNAVRIPARENPCVYLTLDDGPNPEVTPKVLDLLDQYACSCTFFVIGNHARRYPDLLREILRRGHAIGNHSDVHGHAFALHSVRGYEKELQAAQQTIFEITGVSPRYFRAPFGFRSPLLEPALCKVGLHLVSWTRRGFDTRCQCPGTILKRLTQNLAAGDILLLHDGPFGHTLGGKPMVLEVLPMLLDELRSRGLTSAVLPNAFLAEN